MPLAITGTFESSKNFKNTSNPGFLLGERELGGRLKFFSAQSVEFYNQDEVKHFVQWLRYFLHAWIEEFIHLYRTWSLLFSTDRRTFFAFCNSSHRFLHGSTKIFSFEMHKEFSSRIDELFLRRVYRVVRLFFMDQWIFSTTDIFIPFFFSFV